MNIENDIFKKYKPDYKKLVQYGFIKNKTKYLYETKFNNNEFKIIIEITGKGKITSKVYDIENNDEFLPLKIKSAQGTFVGNIKEEYKNILIDVRNNCFSKNYFVSDQANRITEFIISKYGSCPEFMWEKFPGYGVFKNPENSKWYGLIGNLDYSKLGEDNKNFVEIINIKLDKEKIPFLIKQKGFYPAWHMNKIHWITIVLDETLSDELIMDLIEESYSYTVK